MNGLRERDRWASSISELCGTEMGIVSKTVSMKPKMMMITMMMIIMT